MSNDKSIAEVIGDMSEGEIFLYSATYNEKLVIREDELHLMFCYHGEMHKAERDYGDEAYQLLDEMYNNGDQLDLPADLRQRMKAIVDGPAEDHAKGKLPANAPYTAIYVEPTEGLELWQFFECHAVDGEHAQEQCENAYPTAKVLWVNIGHGPDARTMESMKIE